MPRNIYMIWNMSKTSWEGPTCFETWFKHVKKDLHALQHATKAYANMFQNMLKICWEWFKCFEDA
jgi:hypothetical protein